MIDGEPLTENPAIQVWLARNFPKAKLLPEDPMQYVLIPGQAAHLFQDDGAPLFRLIAAQRSD
jgi:glutathione S-transferase